jgi:hypothetical protein
MAFDFPSTPAIGQQYTVGTATYQWDGTAWNLVPLNTPPIASPSPPANPYNGQLWWNAENGKLYVWYVDGDSAQWVQTAGYNGIQKTAEIRNRIYNPAMQISQELAKDTTYGPGAHLADQWFFYASGFTGSPLAALRPVDNEWCARMSSSGLSAPTASALLEIVQRIEGVTMEDAKFGTVDAKPLVLRFRAKSSVAGTFGASYHNAASDRSFVKNCVIAANVATDYVIPIPGDVTGTWPVGGVMGAMVAFACSAGSTFKTATEGAWVAGNFFGATGMTDWVGAANSLEISRVGLHLDPDNTGKAPPFETPNFADELMRCKRYWHTDRIDFNSYNAGGQATTMRFGFPTSMRTLPVISESSIAQGNSTFMAFDTFTTSGFRLYVTAVATGVLYRSSNYTANARM